MFRLLALAVFALLLLPAGAHAACGVQQARAEFETADAQVYVQRGRVYVCDRATGLARRFGVRDNDGSGTDEFDGVNALLDHRYLYTSFVATFAESPDVRRDSLINIRTGRYIRVTVHDEDTDDEVVALPGALISAGAGGVLVHYLNGRVTRLSSVSSEAPAVSGARVYWREGGVAKTATVNLPATATGHSAPTARTIGSCKPRSGARLLIHDGPVVVTRVGSTTWACRRGTTRKVGAADTVAIVSDRDVAYTRTGFSGRLDVARGTRHELDRTSGGLVANAADLLAVGSAGLRAWPDGRSAPSLLAAPPVSDVALSDGSVAYWRDGAGTPHAVGVT